MLDAQDLVTFVRGLEAEMTEELVGQAIVSENLCVAEQARIAWRLHNVTGKPWMVHIEEQTGRLNVVIRPLVKASDINVEFHL